MGACCAATGAAMASPVNAEAPNTDKPTCKCGIQCLGRDDGWGGSQDLAQQRCSAAARIGLSMGSPFAEPHVREVNERGIGQERFAKRRRTSSTNLVARHSVSRKQASRDRDRESSGMETLALARAGLARRRGVTCARLSKVGLALQHDMPRTNQAPGSRPAARPTVYAH